MNDRKNQTSWPDPLKSLLSCEEIFGSIEEAKLAIRGTLRAYFQTQTDSEQDSLFLRACVIRFENVKALAVEIDHQKDTIVYTVPEPLGNRSELLKQQIRSHLQIDYLKTAIESRTRTAAFLFSLLKPSAKRALLDAERQRDRIAKRKHRKT